jgi:undecaprenyl diphosphate synthase
MDTSMINFKSKTLHTDVQLPTHIAFIMDGNGRWAKKRGLPRIAGHKAGGDTLRRLVRHAGELGIKYMSVYAFSTENWSRPEEEVNGLMKLLVEFCKGEVAELKANNTRLKFIGDIINMPTLQREAIYEAEQSLSTCTGMQLNICMNYGSRQELANAIKSIVNDSVSSNDITEELISRYLYTDNIPDPDLLIRTSGEMRLSNFFLWQLAYTEFVFTDKLWPDMTENDLDKCIQTYIKRDRRFGKI